jgi:hippurate hydrolase
MIHDAKHYFAYMQRHTDALVAIRRDIHQHPELGFEEHRTSELVAQHLERWGYRVERGIAGTGVVGQLVCGDGPRRLGLRADMDALPIDEKTGVPYASVHAGIMHACGHDGHTAMLLGAAQYLAETRHFNGTLNLIFQPAEEGMGGARRMIAEGLFERYPCDAIYALHNMPGYPERQLVFRDGATMASSDYATIVVSGVGGHGAHPHRCADPIVAAASIVMTMQTIVARNVPPMQMAVVTVGAIHGGKANNVVPDTVTLEVSVRALDRDVRALLEQRIKALVVAQAESYGVKAIVDYRQGFPVLVNTDEATAFARQVALQLVGESQVTLEGPPRSGSEDFAFMLEHCPGSYLFLGAGMGEEVCVVHNPTYNFNDALLPTGAAYWSCLTERFLAAA